MSHCRLGDGRSAAEDAAAAMHACIAASDRQIAQDASSGGGDHKQQQQPQGAQQQMARLLLDAGQVFVLCTACASAHCCNASVACRAKVPNWHILQPMLLPTCSDDTAFMLLATTTKSWLNAG